MAFRCDNCKYIFSAKRTSCPFCGSRVYNDSSTNEELTILGFSFAPDPKSNPNSANQQDTNDPFKDLRIAFETEHGTTQNTYASIPAVIGNKPTQTTPLIQKQKEPNFFSQFETPTSSTNDIPTVTPNTLSAASALSSKSYEQELRDLERQQRRTERQYRLRSTLNFLSTIRWFTIFRILSIVLAIIIVIAAVIFIIANMEAIISFLITCAIIISIACYLLRTAFRR